MSKTMIGIVTFGNLEFTRLTIQEIRRTTSKPFELFVVVGKPGDVATERWLIEEGIPRVCHGENFGFPASLNDIYDFAWPSLVEPSAPGQPGRFQRNPKPGWVGWEDADHLIIAGNDVVPYPRGIDALIEAAESTDYEWICSSQFDVRSLCERYPEARRYFEGSNYQFTDFNARPWELHQDFHAAAVEPEVIKDVHNLCLYKRSVAEKIGYIDVNFFPAYFSDNDYCYRALLTRTGDKPIKSCGLAHSAYFHFWSRTIHQGSGGSNDRHFMANADFYQRKWGGPFGAERFKVPFNGEPTELFPGLKLPNTVKIGNRDDEGRIARWWRDGK